jgi:hypothetical protein
MRNQEPHISDQDLLLLADGELKSRRSAEVRRHLAACCGCRTRVKEIEGTIADFVHLRHSDLDPQIPPVAGPRALLRARIAEAVAASPKSPGIGWFHFAGSRPAWIYAFSVLVMAAGILILHREGTSSAPRVVELRGDPVPNVELTPGATRPVTQSEICSAGRRDMNRAVSRSVRREVFKEYGISEVSAKDYEVDYLITPELGGTDDIRNLWPEPYSSTDWGAHVKDALEDRLHQMVCGGKIDLTTAQREMSGNWISAYKKYFHTEKPLFIDSANPAKKSQDETGSGKST